MQRLHDAFLRRTCCREWLVGLLLLLCAAMAAPALAEPDQAVALSQLALRFEEPLVAEGPTSAEEDRDLAQAITAYRARADRACTAERSDSGRSAAEDGGRRLFCFAMQSVRRDPRESVINVIGRTRRKIVAERRCGAGPLAA